MIRRQPSSPNASRSDGPRAYASSHLVTHARRVFSKSIETQPASSLRRFRHQLRLRHHWLEILLVRWFRESRDDRVEVEFRCLGFLLRGGERVFGFAQVDRLI